MSFAALFIKARVAFVDKNFPIWLVPHAVLHWFARLLHNRIVSCLLIVPLKADRSGANLTGISFSTTNVLKVIDCYIK